ncbi:MAG: PaaX family transcriptional regulator C-terminal domain-containing protein [Candidatus Binatia bacterium]
MKPRPKSVVLDLLSTLKGHSAPVRFLVAAAEIFDIDPNATRVAITRLLSGGLIERDERGAYRTGAAASPILNRLNSWRRMQTRTRPWDGSWIGATPDGCAASKEERLIGIRAFEFTGMREFAPGLWIRPNNLDGGLEAAREALITLRLNPGCPVFTIGDFDEAGEARARALWDAAAIRELYRSLSLELERSAAQLPNMDERRAMAECFLLGGEAIRRIVLDPLLPDAIVPTVERDNLVHAMVAYDEVGRRVWAPFLNRFGVLASESPVDRQIWREAAAAADIASTPL